MVDCFAHMIEPFYVWIEPDSINHGNANIFDGSQKIFVSYEVPARFVWELLNKYTRMEEGRNFLQERPPDCAAVGASDVLAQVVQEDPVSAEEKEE